MAGELGAYPVLCSLVGGETGRVLEPLLERMPGERRLVRSDSSSGCYVTDRRSGEREVLAQAYIEPPSRHEADELVAATTAAALECNVLAICNPYPGDALPIDAYRALVTNARGAGVRVVADLSSPRIEAAAAARPELVKLNDWELAAFTRGPVDTPERLRGAAETLRDLGAANVLVTRAGDPALALLDGEVWELVPPKFEVGSREGCDDTMMGAISAALALGGSFPMHWSWARPPAPSTSSITASEPAPVERSRSSAPRSLCAGSKTGSEMEAPGPHPGGSRPVLLGNPVEMRSQHLDSLECRKPLGDPQRPSSMRRVSVARQHLDQPAPCEREHSSRASPPTK